jgi:hypothetical protein
VQRAFNTPLFNSIRSPTFKRETGDISTDLSLRHTHRTALRLKDDEEEESDEDEEANPLERINNFEQFFTISNFNEPPSFVESAKVIKILLPSEEN